MPPECAAGAHALAPSSPRRSALLRRALGHVALRSPGPRARVSLSPLALSSGLSLSSSKIYAELDERGRIDAVTRGAVAVAAALYVAIAACGYATFGSSVASNLLLSYPHASAAVTLARVAIAVLVLFSFPFQVPPARDAILTIAAARARVTIGLLAAAYLVAVSVADLGLILSLIGASASISIAFIIPGAVYARLHPHPHAKRAAALGLAGAGVALLPACIAANFLH